MKSIWLILLAVIGLALSGPAQARKVALVIGNGGYTGTTRLANPGNDSKLVSEAAKQAGFDVVLVNDLTINGFQRTLRDFRILAEGADVAMVYYAGHGMEGQGQNWLIPVDARLETEFDLPYEAINLDRLLESVSGARVRMLVLDACRNNPFGNRWKRGVRAVPSGLAGMDVDDVLVIYAAAPGQVATDGRGGNSPFAISLAKRLPEPGLPIQLLGGAVRDDVLAATGGNQRPFVSASITGTPVYLVAQVQASAGGDRSTMEALMWQGAESANNMAGYQAYLQEFPAGIFAKMAGERMAKLRTPPPVVAAVVAPVVTQPAPKPAPAQAIPTTPSSYSSASPAALSDKAPLPEIPPAPAFPKDGFPACREDYKKKDSTNDKVDAVNACTGRLDAFYRTTLADFRSAMSRHQDVLSRLYLDKVGGHQEYTPASQDRFFAAINLEHAASNPDGAHFTDHRAAEERYKVDRAYLQDRYCFLTGCGGYPKPKN